MNPIASQTQIVLMLALSSSNKYEVVEYSSIFASVWSSCLIRLIFAPTMTSHLQISDPLCSRCQDVTILKHDLFAVAITFRLKSNRIQVAEQETKRPLEKLGPWNAAYRGGKNMAVLSLRRAFTQIWDREYAIRSWCNNPLSIPSILKIETRWITVHWTRNPRYS